MHHNQQTGKHSVDTSGAVVPISTQIGDKRWRKSVCMASGTFANLYMCMKVYPRCCNRSSPFSCCLTLSLLQIFQWSRLRHAHSVLESFHLLLYDLSSEVLLNEVCHVDKMEWCLCMTYTVTVAGNFGKDTFACSLEDSH